ncbi:unnamed protein product [Dovyalis caffra]|uniref:BHLH domain-containing protein n=1 Tax=Dovyalis caffra TaxID=77055 RepID=A0AAV1SK30_9ROSI|nr:unnamed protein product [Dovyalis caffra]
MAEEFQAGICGENWWMNSSKNVFMGGLSPCSTVSISTSDHMGSYGSWATADMADLKGRSISCKGSNNMITTSASDTSIPFLNSQKTQQADSDSGGSSILIDSTLQMMGFGLSSSSSSSSDWNQALLPGNGRTESYNSMLQEDMNSGGLNSSQIQKEWSPKNYTSSAEDFSLDQQRLNPVDSSGNSPPTCQGFSTGFSMEPSATNYGYPSTLIQSLFESGHPQQQQVQPLFNHRSMNYLSPTAPNYGTNMNELSSPSWPKVSPMIKSSLPKQQPSRMHFTNNTPYWNASPTGVNDIRASFLPSSQSQFLLPTFEETPNYPNLSTKPSKEEVRESVSVVKKGSEPAFKRPRIETPSPLPTFKVRKEKLGDRITALQQLVSPFGKTDTASVLHEAIGYIKFLHDQVSVLSTTYMKNGNPIQHQQVLADKLNDLEGPKQDLRSRGLCLVPISSTFPVANETTADFWTPTFGGTFR